LIPQGDVFDDFGFWVEGLLMGDLSIEIISLF
jgi:hypothetical protein